MSEVIIQFVCSLLVFAIGCAITRLAMDKDIRHKNAIINSLKEDTIKQQERILKLERDLTDGHNSVMSIINRDDTPEDCKRGVWCQGCHHNKRVSKRVYGHYESIYYCGKAETCKNFVQIKTDD